MRTVCVIPARMGSSRFPNKPLTPIMGMPMIGHVALRCQNSKLFEEVIVATCDQEIRDYCESISVQSVMTSHLHERASDRVQEAVKILESVQKSKFDIVLMVQGDEPLVTKSMLKTALDAVVRSQAPVVNLMAPITDEEEWRSPNCVKVVANLVGDALYFSREPIPSGAKYKTNPKAWKQVCVIPFTREFLDTYSALTPTYLEEVESIDMNRVLEHGYRVHCSMIDDLSYPVDVPEDVIKVEKVLSRQLDQLGYMR